MQDGFSGRPAPSRRGGFPEPFLAQDPAAADCRRRQCLEDLIREDVVEFSRIGEIRAMRLFVAMLRERVGSPLSLASIARDLQVSPTSVAKYLDILEALYIVLSVRPYHRNIARAILNGKKWGQSNFSRKVTLTLIHSLSAWLRYSQPSPFDEAVAVAVSVDGFGDFASAAWGLGRGSRVEAERRIGSL